MGYILVDTTLESGITTTCVYVGVVCVLLHSKGFTLYGWGQRHCFEAVGEVLFTHISLDVWVGSVRAAVVTVVYWCLCFVLSMCICTYVRMFEGNSCRRCSRLEICLVWDWVTWSPGYAGSWRNVFVR